MKVLLTKSLESVETSLVGEEETSVLFHSKLICASGCAFQHTQHHNMFKVQIDNDYEVQTTYIPQPTVLSSVQWELGCHISRVHGELLTWTNDC